jgi:O-antigen ligase
MRALNLLMSSSPIAATYLVSPLGRAHNVWLSIYIAVLVGKFGEWIPGLASIPLAKVAFLLAAFFTFRVRARLPRVFVRKLPIARPAIYFLILALISLVFTVYIGQSVGMSYGVAIALASVIILLKVTQTISDFERLLFALTVAAAGLALATIFSYAGGRAQINGNFDPNDLAYGLVTILPIIRALAVTATKRKLLLNGLAAATIAAVILTGSRGAAIALCVEVLLVVAFPLSFAKDGGLKRFHLLRFIVTTCAVVGLFFASWSYLPVEIRQRVATLVNLQDDYNLSSSKDGRTEIWSQDIAAVWKRPIGYGLGTSEYVNGISGGHYRAPHNSFIQAFVELGVLGVVLLALSYLFALTQLGKVSRRDRSSNAPLAPRAALYARALRFSVVANLVAGFFLSHAYDALLWILIAICAALVRIEGASTAGAPPPAPT